MEITYIRAKVPNSFLRRMKLLCKQDRRSTLSENRKDLQVSTLVGLTRENPELDPQAVLHLDNRLYITQLTMFLKLILTSLIFHSRGRRLIDFPTTTATTTTTTTAATTTTFT